eukprot:6958941-Prymnesium_polylepis.1
MNNYGVVLNDIGLRPALDELQALVHPVARGLFPVEGAKFEDHHSFVVSYRPDQDKGLDMRERPRPAISNPPSRMRGALVCEGRGHGG